MAPLETAQQAWLHEDQVLHCHTQPESNDPAPWVEEQRWERSRNPHENASRGRCKLRGRGHFSIYLPISKGGKYGETSPRPVYKTNKGHPRIISDHKRAAAPPFPPGSYIQVPKILLHKSQEAVVAPSWGRRPSRWWSGGTRSGPGSRRCRS